MCGVFVGISLPVIGVAAEAVGLRSAGIGFGAVVATLALTVLMSLVRRGRRETAQ